MGTADKEAGAASVRVELCGGRRPGRDYYLRVRGVMAGLKIIPRRSKNRSNPQQRKQGHGNPQVCIAEGTIFEMNPGTISKTEI